MADAESTPFGKGNCFSTILVARTPSARPTGMNKTIRYASKIELSHESSFLIMPLCNAAIELEVQLRDVCQKIRVHANLSGAHMIFPQEQGLAIRIYYPNDIIEQDDNPDDIDGILEFCHKFQWSMVLFVVPDLTVLNDMNSFVQSSMQLLDYPLPPTKAPPRFILVSNTAQAILAIKECAETITPMRCALRSKFTDKIRTASFCPKVEGSMSEKNIVSTSEEELAYNTAAAQQVQTALCEWGVRAGIPRGETDVLLRVLPTLGQLVSAKEDQIGMIPVEGSTKQKWRRFLSAPDSDTVDSSNNMIDDATVISPPPTNPTFIGAPVTLPVNDEAMYKYTMPVTTEASFPQKIPAMSHPHYMQQLPNRYNDPNISENNMHMFHHETFITPEQCTAMRHQQETPQWFPSHMVPQRASLPSLMSHHKYQASALPWGQPVVRSSWSSPPLRLSMCYPNDSMGLMARRATQGDFAPVYSTQGQWQSVAHMAMAAATPYGDRQIFQPPHETNPKYLVRKFM